MGYNSVYVVSRLDDLENSHAELLTAENVYDKLTEIVGNAEISEVEDFDKGFSEENIDGIMTDYEEEGIIERKDAGVIKNAFAFTKETIPAYFERRYKKFLQLVSEMNLESFSDEETAKELCRLVCERDYDYVIFITFQNNQFKEDIMPMDTFIRRMEKKVLVFSQHFTYYR